MCSTIELIHGYMCTTWNNNQTDYTRACCVYVIRATAKQNSTNYHTVQKQYTDLHVHSILVAAYTSPVW